jgi:hypothetical protein
MANIFEPEWIAAVPSPLPSLDPKRRDYEFCDSRS